MWMQKAGSPVLSLMSGQAVINNLQIAENQIVCYLNSSISRSDSRSVVSQSVGRSVGRTVGRSVRQSGMRWSYHITEATVI